MKATSPYLCALAIVAASFTASCSSENSQTKKEQAVTLVREVAPANGAVDVRTDAVLTVVFTAAMAENTIVASNITVADPESTVKVAVTYNTETRTASIDASLERGQTYTVKLNPSIRAVAGDQLIGGYSWGFTTVK